LSARELIKQNLDVFDERPCLRIYLAEFLGLRWVEPLEVVEEKRHWMTERTPGEGARN
jgi:hypothetical protein